MVKASARRDERQRAVVQWHGQALRRDAAWPSRANTPSLRHWMAMFNSLVPTHHHCGIGCPCLTLWSQHTITAALDGHV